MVKVKLLVDIEGIGEKGDYVSMGIKEYEMNKEKVKVRRETKKDGSYL